MTRKTYRLLSLLILTGFVAACSSPDGSSAEASEQSTGFGDPIHEHTNPPIVLRPGASPPTWWKLDDREDPTPLPPNQGNPIFNPRGCVGGASGEPQVLNVGVVGFGVDLDSLEAKYLDDGSNVEDLSKPFTLRSDGAYSDGSYYALEVRLSEAEATYYMTRTDNETIAKCRLRSKGSTHTSRQFSPREFSYLTYPKVYHDGRELKENEEGVVLEFSTYEEE